MGRPKKEKSLLMNRPLRIMLTAEQDALIRQAAESEGMDMTAWARPILLEAAHERMEKVKDRKKTPKGGHIIN
jgi:uncharacterized protein (DUF1778 family)